MCFLARNDKKYPSNLNTSGNNWEMLVLGEETDTTRSNAALTPEDGVTYLNNKIKVKVNSITDDSLTFEIDGIDESTNLLLLVSLFLLTKIQCKTVNLISLKQH